MLLLYMTVSSLFIGSSAAITEEHLCYGGNLKIPFPSISPHLFSRQLYFTPKEGGSRKLLLDKEEAKDPRLKVSYVSVRLIDLTDRDEGTFSISLDGDALHDMVELTIKDCAEEYNSHYGSLFYWRIPRKAEFLEFTPLRRRGQPQVMWNRTDPQTNKEGRGKVNDNSWEMHDLRQADSGFYNFRGKDNMLLDRKKLSVKEWYRYYDPMVNEPLIIEYPTAITFTLGEVTFTYKGNMEPKIQLRRAGNPDREENWNLWQRHFMGRLTVLHKGLQIDPVEIADSGTFHFRDTQGNLIQTVNLDVKQGAAPTFVYVAIVVGIIFAVILCCCCVRKCCCKKSSSKRDTSAPQSAAACATNYHDRSQPAGPSTSAASSSAFSYQPVNHHVSTHPTTTFLGPSAAVKGGQGTAPAPSVDADCLSSDPAPKFYLKGLNLSTASPLGTGSTFCDVYTSNKLNFL
ncbi:uncharacterized protein LOC111646677 [Seriola lalandi dorsalis]|uniref:uncharacterized protein LOC111646677 n=1 Tax=Seriola lalandi dorsalis TaxID=1841481 RepID=UPI000C6FB97E|nr:uncharacterized protein LOC111646677 [Seriola lalandi dorsalis]XP_023252002.1 uncharacterized protein LOC111646677 [Seriola lalandi dorsalis]